MIRNLPFLLAVLVPVIATPLLAQAPEAPLLALELEVHGGGDAPVPVVVEVTAAEMEASRRVEGMAPGRLEVAPAGAPPWTLHAEADGFWSAPRRLEPPVGEPPVLHLWPAVRVRGRVEVPEGHSLPPGLSFRVQRAPSSEAPGAALEATVLCPLTQGRMDCSLPAVDRLDLRLRAPGFSSRFFWDLDLSGSAVHDLGTVRLRPGASVVGRVEVPAGHALQPVVVRLAPVGGAPLAGEAVARAEAQVTREAGVDERGFSSLDGLTAGSYRLEVTHPDLALYELTPVRVVDGSQSEVAEVIVLREPTPLRLVLDPPFDPWGQDWRVRLYRSLSSGQQVRVLGEEDLVATAGAVDVTTAPGRYEVRVLDSRGRPGRSPGHQAVPRHPRPLGRPPRPQLVPGRRCGQRPPPVARPLRGVLVPARRVAPAHGDGKRLCGRRGPGRGHPDAGPAGGGDRGGESGLTPGSGRRRVFSTASWGAVDPPVTANGSVARDQGVRLCVRPAARGRGGAGASSRSTSGKEPVVACNNCNGTGKCQGVCKGTGDNGSGPGSCGACHGTGKCSSGGGTG